MKRLISRLFGSGDDTEPAPARTRLVRDPAAYGAVYAVGDVHGCHSALLALEAMIVADASTRPGDKLIVMLGDYIDRGPRSKQVLDHLSGAPPDGFERILLTGNHEDVFLAFLHDPEEHVGWLELGGIETLMSYGIDCEPVLARGGPAALGELARQAVPAAHVEALREAAVCVSLGNILFVHAGIRPGIPLDRQRDEDMIWIRQPFIANGPELPLFVIHGHTPSTEPSRAPGRLGIDTRCFASGVLTAARIVGEDVEILQTGRGNR